MDGRGRPSLHSLLAAGEQLKSEDFEMYCQVLLRILPDRFDQLLRVGEQLVAIVIKRRIVQESASGAFALVQPIGNIDSRLMVFCNLLANCWSLVRVPNAPLPELMSSLSCLKLPMV